MSVTPGPIGIFGSGIVGFTVYQAIATQFVNARVPYGTRSFETVLKG